MKIGYRFTTRARNGFLSIARYVDERFGPRVAGRVVTDLVDAFEILSTNPTIGQRRADLTSDERIGFWSVGPTLIAYCERSDGIEILFVEPGADDWQYSLRKYVE